LPISVAIGLFCFRLLGFHLILSLTGIVLQLVLVDDGIVMVENAYRTISEKQEEMDNNQ
jgi:Cu(I)/Ag(I) efflux system membrane protein CusA/SilA